MQKDRADLRIRFPQGHFQQLQTCNAASSRCYLLTGLLPLTRALWTGLSAPGSRSPRCTARSCLHASPSARTLQLHPQEPPLHIWLRKHILHFGLKRGLSAVSCSTEPCLLCGITSTSQRKGSGLCDTEQGRAGATRRDTERDPGTEEDPDPKPFFPDHLIPRVAPGVSPLLTAQGCLALPCTHLPAPAENQVRERMSLFPQTALCYSHNRQNKTTQCRHPFSNYLLGLHSAWRREMSHYTCRQRGLFWFKPRNVEGNYMDKVTALIKVIKMLQVTQPRSSQSILCPSCSRS